ANLLPGLVVEQAEGNRVLAITSARRPQIMYPDRGGAYQCFDQAGVIGRIAKWSAAASSYDRVPELARKALRASWAGRPGVVHLDVPETVMNGSFDPLPQWAPQHYRRVEPLAPRPDQVAQAADRLLAAAAPMIHVGSGVVHAQAFDALAAVAEALHAPVTTSWAARGALPETSLLAIPMPHVALNHRVRNEADAVLVVGSRIGETDWWGKPPYWRRASEQFTVQVDIDETMIGLNKPADLAIQADAGEFLRALAQALAGRAPANLDQRRQRAAAYQKARADERAGWDKALQDMNAPVHPAHIGAACDELFPPGTVLVADGGNAAVWAMFHHRATVPNRVLSTFKFGMLGAGMAQAIGAAHARPGEPVCCIIGDGAFGFHPQEVETAVRTKARVVWIVLADKQWGMVKMNQQFMLRPFKTMLFKKLDDDETIKADLHEVAFDQLARSMGAHGERVSDPQALRAAIVRGLDSGGPAVIHVDVDPVKHMWAPGLMHFKKMHEEPKG
ncbi:MAG: thiamine pyrophosphate-binding protein, partial [Rhodoferax sp.]|nr:thiamine pyrophosphate-binding protein [Rhodoferax sp.]